MEYDKFDQPPTAQPPVSGLDFVRLSGDHESVMASLGPLSNLLGTWVGNHGWNVIAVPALDKGKESFLLLIRPYIESITFTPLGAPVPDRGGAETLFITGLQYDLRVTDAETNQPLHLENGMWLYLNQVQVPGGPLIVRQATIPHGDSVLALGQYTVEDGPPQIPVINAIPDPGPTAPAGYTDPYLNGPIDTSQLNVILQDAIKEQDITQTVTLYVSTQNDGGIVNIPFVVKHANATAFQGTFWIEKVKSPETGTEFEQLQYVQQTNINFLPQFGNPTELIMWPHVNINTLVKQ
jgi:hypothetical protein